MNRFDRRPVRTVAVILVIALIAVLAAAEWLLTPDGAKHVVRSGDSLSRPQRILVMREWQPATIFCFGAPEIRQRSPGGAVLEEYVLDIDADGFIEPANIHDDPDLRIAFVGGSTTECLFVTPDLRFPYLAGRLLERELGAPVNALNAGKSGNNLMHSLLAVVGKVLPQRPDYLVVMHNVNDLGVLTRTGGAGRTGGYWNDDSDFALVRRRKRDIESVVRDVRDMAVPRTYRAIRRALRGELFGAARAATPPPAATAAPDMERAGDDFESALRSVVGVARAWGVRPVLMTQVLSGSTAEDLAGNYLAEDKLKRRGFLAGSFASAHLFFNAIIRHVAGAENVPLIDLARESWERDDLYDGLHYSDQGSERAARHISRALADIIRAAER